MDYQIAEKVKGQDTEMRKAASAERRSGETKKLSPSKGRANVGKMARDIRFYDKKTKETKPSVLGMVSDDWKPEIEHIKMSDWRKTKKVAKKKKDDEGLPPHLRGDAIGKMRKAFAHTNEEVVVEKDLNAAERRALPDKEFALPGKGKGPEGKQAGSYPIPDKTHARMALAMVAKHGTPEKKKKVRAAVEKKFPGIKVTEDKAFNSVVAALRKKHGKDAVLTKDSPKPKPPSDAEKAKAAAERKKRQDADNKAYTARARKAGYKNTQDYTNVVARYGSEDNYRKGKGLGT